MEIQLNSNKFEGEVTLSRLPDGIMNLSLENNCFLEGVVCRRDLPESLNYFECSGTRIKVEEF